MPTSKNGQPQRPWSLLKSLDLGSWLLEVKWPRWDWCLSGMSFSFIFTIYQNLSYLLLLYLLIYLDSWHLLVVLLKCYNSTWYYCLSLCSGHSSQVHKHMFVVLFFLFYPLSKVVGCVALALCYPVNVFTSLLLGRVRGEVTSIVTFGDGLSLLISSMAGRYGYAVAYLYLFMCMTNYLVLIGDSVQASLYWEGICSPWACFIGAVLLLPFNQFRTLSGLTLLSAISFATVLLTLFICLWTLLSNPSCEPVKHSHGFLDYSSCLSGFVFAFTGQNIMLEMQAEMKTPSDFPKSVWLSFTILFLVYFVVAVLSYLACGDNTPGDLLLVLPHDWRKSLAGMLMVLHLIVTYTISQQAVLELFWSRYPKPIQKAARSTVTNIQSTKTQLLGFLDVSGGLICARS